MRWSKIEVSKTKLINVRWEDFSNEKSDFIAKISVIIKNKIGSLGSLSSIIGKTLSNIRNLKITERNKDFLRLK